MKFRTKIWMLPLGAALVFLAGMAVSYAVGARTSAALKHLRTVDQPVLQKMQLLDRGLEEFRLLLQGAASEGDAEKLKDVESVAARVRTVLDGMSSIDTSDARAKELRGAFEAYQSAALGATRAMLERKDAQKLVSEMQVRLSELQSMAQRHSKSAESATEQSQGEVDRGIQLSLLVTLLTGLTVLVVLGLTSRAVINSVWRDLGREPSELLTLTRRIAEGQLHVECNVQAGDERSLNAGLAEMVERLRVTVDTIRQAAGSINVASNHIAEGNQDLSHRTENAATNLQATALSVDVLTESVRNSAQAASQANELAGAAVQAAQRGGNIVSQVVTSMSEITAQSKRVGEIVGVIDSIAFQTNILALNAAVEAARAGDSGRGFSVVASEVRSLAHRSAEAAREIKSLIAASGEKVEAGSMLVQDAGTAMEQIVVGIRGVTDAIAEISAAASEQSEGIGRVNNAVTTLERMTQQNAALVEQSASAASKMHDQAGRLTSAVAAFRLEAVPEEAVAVGA